MRRKNDKRGKLLYESDEKQMAMTASKRERKKKGKEESDVTVYL